MIKPETLRLVVQNDSVAAATGLWLFFGMSRGLILGAQVSGVGPDSIAGESDRNGVRFTWPGHQVLVGSQVTVEISYRGEPPPWSGNARWVGTDDHLLSPSDIRLTTFPLADDYLKTPLEFAARRRQEIDKLVNGEQKDFHEFFYELDCATLPSLFEAEVYLPTLQGTLRARASQELSEALRERMMERGRHVDAPWHPTPDLESSSDLIHHISVLMSGIVRRHFRRLDRGDVTASDRAFEMFSCGGLSLHADEWNLPLNGQPNGSNYFLFAEFAFTAIELGIDSDFWERMQNVLVRTQRVFMRAFAPPKGEPKGYGSYVTNKPQAINDDFIRRLRTCYASLGTRELIKRAAINARVAFAIMS